MNWRDVLAWLRGRRPCRHEFAIEDLRLTGIHAPTPPAGNDYEVWCEFYAGEYLHESHTKRVAWPCDKCGQVFYAHCGLDISPKHGPTFRREHRMKNGAPPIGANQ